MFRTNIGWGVVAYACFAAIGLLMPTAWLFAGRHNLDYELSFLAITALAALPGVLVVLRLISQTSRLPPALLGVVAASAGVTLAWLANRGFRPPTLLSPLSVVLLDRIQFTGVVILGGLVLTLVLYPLRHVRPGRVVSQIGSRCWRCAYELTGLPEGSPCPECGHAPQVQLRWRPLASFERFIGRWLVPIAVVCAVLGPVIYTARWHADWRPKREALSTLGASRFVADRMMSDTIHALEEEGFATLDIRTIGGDAAIFDIPGHPDLMLAVAFPEAVRPGAHHVMEIQVTPVDHGDEHYYAGAYTTLNAEQAAAVLESGVPERLVARLAGFAQNVQDEGGGGVGFTDAAPYFDR